MDLIDTFNITASGLAAQRTRVQTSAANLANARTTRTEEGGPYQRRVPVFKTAPIDPFGSALDQELAMVEVAEIEVDTSPGQRIYDPAHPDADDEGFVMLPNVEILTEMVDLMSASRAYEANANVLDVTSDLAMRALRIGGG